MTLRKTKRIQTNKQKKTKKNIEMSIKPNIHAILCSKKPDRLQAFKATADFEKE